MRWYVHRGVAADIEIKSNIQEQEDDMDLKALFADGALTYDEFLARLQEQKINLANIAEGGYVSKNKYDDKMASLTQQIADLQGQVTQRDTDLASINDQLTAAKADAGKLPDVQNTLTTLQAQYAADKKTWEERNAQQAYEFMIREKANGLRFTSGAAKKEFIREAIKKGFKVDGENLLGYQDFLTQYQTDDPGAFAKEEPQKLEEPTPTIVLPNGPTPETTKKRKSLSDLMRAKNSNPNIEVKF